LLLLFCKQFKDLVLIFELGGELLLDGKNEFVLCFDGGLLFFKLFSKCLDFS